jgi:hypothetical protein
MENTFSVPDTNDLSMSEKNIVLGILEEKEHSLHTYISTMKNLVEEENEYEQWKKDNWKLIEESEKDILLIQKIKAKIMAKQNSRAMKAMKGLL